MTGTHGPRKHDAVPRPSRSGAPHGLVPRGAVPSVRCSATNSRGEPCGAWAIVGGTVCVTHGGSAPQVRAAAERRLQELVSPALLALEEHLTNEAIPAAVRQRAIDSVLDRTGHKQPEVHVEVSAEQANDRLDEAIRQVLRARYPDAIDVEAEEA